MLELGVIQLLSDALRPPTGMTFDRGLISTFSLDLDAALSVPLLLAAMQQPTDSALDPVAFLESLRKSAGRLVIFNQTGQIKVPAQYLQLMPDLEPMIVGCVAPSQHHIFHPKVWLLRFTDGETHHLRFLCLSRNLTFDKSWDVVLQLESSDPAAEPRRDNAPLVDFTRALAGMAVLPVTSEQKATVDELAQSAATAYWELPPGVRTARFLPFGITGHSSWPFPNNMIRTTVVSPFLTADTLQRIASSTRETLSIVSRQESLDRIDELTLKPFLSVEYFPKWNDAEFDDVTDEQLAEGAQSELSGLHAKIFMADVGMTARAWVGSANATTAAFGGNIEFLVELEGSRTHLGPGLFFGGADERAKFLLPYDRTTAHDSLPDDEHEKRNLARYQRALAAIPMRLRVTPEGDNYNLHLTSQAEIPGLDDTEVQAWPISLGDQHSRLIEPGEPADADFGARTFEAITSFVAFKLTMGSLETRFVINVELIGAPSDRHERRLAAILNDQDKLMRYLFLLLADEETWQMVADNSGAGGGWIAQMLGSKAPLELMVRTLHRRPRRIDDLADVIERLRTQNDGADRFPDHFLNLWDAIWSARKSVRR